MSNDLALLKVFCKLSAHTSYRGLVKNSTLAEESRTILQDYNGYFEEFKKDVELGDFVNWFFNLRHPEFNDKQIENYRLIFDRVKATEDKDIDTLLKHFQMEELYTKLEDMHRKHEPITEVNNLIKETMQKLNLITVSNEIYETNTFQDIFSERLNPTGLHWRLKCLENCLGPITNGDSTIIAAYVNSGKTTFLASEVSYMAQQLPEDKRVLWFNTEGSNRRAQRRIWSATLGVPIHKILEQQEKADKLYYDKMKLRNRIIFPKNAGKMTYKDIQRIVEEVKPGLIVIDQLDYITGFRSDSHTNNLTLLYQWARVLSTEFAPLLAVTQVDNSVNKFDAATGKYKPQRYIEMHQLNGSKVGKQGAAENIITIGFDPEYPKTRYIHVPKMKEGSLSTEYRNIKQEVRFEGEIARYLD